ncbi:hypothetical protein [Mesorhizobium sp.]|uniref:hypothetical protein n=1 Tax=Mesorhizobium sp. TaxID=1871066 RepID=UPI0025F40123|nr:hypothetical protein [Mesorhizobium sp.]
MSQPLGADQNQRKALQKVPVLECASAANVKIGAGRQPVLLDVRKHGSADSKSYQDRQQHNAHQARDKDDPARAGSQDDLALSRLLCREDRSSAVPIVAHDLLLSVITAIEGQPSSEGRGSRLRPHHTARNQSQANSATSERRPLSQAHLSTGKRIRDLPIRIDDLIVTLVRRPDLTTTIFNG